MSSNCRAPNISCPCPARRQVLPCNERLDSDGRKPAASTLRRFLTGLRASFRNGMAKGHADTCFGRSASGTQDAGSSSPADVAGDAGCYRLQPWKSRRSCCALSTIRTAGRRLSVDTALVRRTGLAAMLADARTGAPGGTADGSDALVEKSPSSPATLLAGVAAPITIMTGAFDGAGLAMLIAVVSANAGCTRSRISVGADAPTRAIRA